MFQLLFTLCFAMTITISSKENNLVIEEKITSMLQQRKKKKIQEKELLMKEILERKLFAWEDPLVIQKKLRDERN